jgi:hypothetical protein
MSGILNSFEIKFIVNSGLLGGSFSTGSEDRR